MRTYVLTPNNKPVKASWISSQKFCLKHAKLATTRVRNLFVSTIFLGEDHRWSSDKGPPILWETSVFNNLGNIVFSWRANSHRKAKSNHKAIVIFIKDNNCPPDSSLFTGKK
jgi:hypothetical protein